MKPPTISRHAAIRRGRALASLRSLLAGQGFIEVTTPLLLAVRPTSSVPRHPFKIQNLEFDLRHSIELLLRTALVVAPRVYDIGPAIRFEDIGKAPRSAVEFTLMELYATDLNYGPLMNLAEDLIRATSMTALPASTRISVTEWFGATFNMHFDGCTDIHVREQLCELLGLGPCEEPLWQLINSCIERFLEPQLSGLSVLYDYPVHTVCLARRSPAAPHVIERFEMFIDGSEVGHGFVDAVDAADVLDRMQKSGPQFVDRSFIASLEAGELPPSAGFGLG